jgi:hypothetical protein
LFFANLGVIIDRYDDDDDIDVVDGSSSLKINEIPLDEKE